MGLALAAAVAVGESGASAGGSSGRPLPIRSASLHQEGQQLVWRLQLASPFSPAALRHGGRTLCLLLDRVRGGRQLGSVCIVGPGRGRRNPRVEYSEGGAQSTARPVVLPATVTRTSPSQLTARFLPSALGVPWRPVRWQVISTLAGRACAPPVPGGGQCFSAFPSQPRRLDLHAPMLTGCRVNGPSWVPRGPAQPREIALTFDDGPWYQSASDNTSRFLDVLEREHAVATFFEVGEHIAAYGRGGAIERRMLADGDMIGDHTWDHANVSRGGAFARAEITRAADAIRSATHGFEPCLFRAPYGAVSSTLLGVARALGMITIQWDVDPRDWARPGTDAIYQNVISHAHAGAIVIQHDGGGDRSETLAALPREIETLRRHGYRLVTVAQLLGYRLVYR